MSQNTDPDESGEPKFGRLLIILILVVLFCAVLTWVMGALFPDFGLSGR